MTFLYGDGIGRVELVDSVGSDKTVVNAARVSFGQDSSKPLDARDEKLIGYLLTNNHTSPFEHCFITWKITVPLFVARQHMRHRTWSYNEISRRYTSEDIQFFIPHVLRTQHASDRQASDTTEVPSPEECRALISNVTNQASAIYESLLTLGLCREQARMVLPQNMYTSYYASANLHNVLRFLTLRLDNHSQKEIQVVAQAMLGDLDRLYPSVIRSWRRLSVSDR